MTGWSCGSSCCGRAPQELVPRSPRVSVCSCVLIRHTTAMPKSRPPGYSRPCLVVGSRGDAVVSRILGDAGFEVESVGSEQEAWAALDRRPWTVLFVAQSVGK